ncbi:hypothetical protein ACJO2E_12470 [Marinobacter sp. M1N3S26]|uniref:hypothetical protein n=1 Tax=Marinobacter sp. M1N3S26 TaxID=3382299 RepID=UPI00387B8D31
MIKVILHIGRHKTGTSSLQRFFYENPELLWSHGLVYPSIYLKRIAHHNLSEPFRPGEFNKLTNREKSSLIADVRSELYANLNQKDVVYLFSSEAFQNVDPMIIRQIFDPNIFEVVIVCYFRDQISYLASAYNQRVHATEYSGTIYDYYRKYFRANYYKFARIWNDAFDSVVYRKYERSSLYRSDLIQDFFKSVLNVELLEGGPPKDSNPSLTEKFVYIKRKINELTANKEISLPRRRRSIYLGLAALSEQHGGEKYSVPPLLALLVFLQYRVSNKKFFDCFMDDSKGFSLKPLWASVKKTGKQRSVTSKEINEVLAALEDDRNN